jgi:predicted Zn-dependent protease
VGNGRKAGLLPVYVSFRGLLENPSRARWHDRPVQDSRDERLRQAVELRENGELEPARQLLLELRREFPEDAQVAVQTAWVHDSIGLEQEAVEHYEAAIAGDLSDDELRGALLGLGSTYRTLGRDEDSDRIFRHGIERFPDFKALRAFRAMTLYNLGRPRDAIEQVLKLLLETTNDPSILRYQRALGAYAEDLDRSWLGS